MVLFGEMKEMKNDEVGGTVEGGEGMKREPRRTGTARQEMKQRRTENKKCLAAVCYSMHLPNPAVWQRVRFFSFL